MTSPLAALIAKASHVPSQSRRQLFTSSPICYARALIASVPELEATPRRRSWARPVVPPRWPTKVPHLPEYRYRLPGRLVYDAVQARTRRCAKLEILTRVAKRVSELSVGARVIALSPSPTSA